MAWYICKYCAKKTTKSLSGFCNRSPSKNHDLIVRQNQYICKYCGKRAKDPFSGPCKTSPHKSHELVG